MDSANKIDFFLRVGVFWRQLLLELDKTRVSWAEEWTARLFDKIVTKTIDNKILHFFSRI